LITEKLSEKLSETLASADSPQLRGFPMSRTGFGRISAFLLAGLLAATIAPSGYCGQGKVTFKTDEVEVPFILWGGDVATFHANGGLITRGGTLFHGQRIRVKLTRGDDFDKQVKNYLEGKSPFLRGTMSMLGEASEQLAKSPATVPVVFLQLTWSAGDHMVARADCKMLGDLKGKKIALQKGGPHVGMLNDVLRTANLQWADILPIWTDDVTGEKGPAALFRKDPSVHACFAITPDMTDLTGGLDKKGTGKDKTVKNAHVLVSTAHMSRSIADVYACRKDFYDQHKDWVEKFAAGYLKASEELVALRRKNREEKGSATYKAILELTQEIYGKDDIKTLDDAEGLVDDAAFVGLPGNISFFTDRGNLSGFRPKMLAALDLAIALKEASQRHEFHTANFDYDKIKRLGDLTGKPLPAERFRQDVPFVNADTIYYFTVKFQPNQSDFPEAQYGQAFQRALEQASLFGNAVMAIRGHTDAEAALKKYEQTGLDKGKFRRGKGKYEFVFNDGTTFDLRDARKVAELIKKDNFGNPDLDLEVNYLQNLSEKRAQTVRNALINFASNKGLHLDKSQMKSVGAGMTEPIIALPNPAVPSEFTANRRVEFRILRVSAESRTAADIDY
jgi:hypothetical protein